MLVKAKISKPSNYFFGQAARINFGFALLVSFFLISVALNQAFPIHPWQMMLRDPLVKSNTGGVGFRRYI
jgi:hypothetical protein